MQLRSPLILTLLLAVVGCSQPEEQNAASPEQPAAENTSSAQNNLEAELKQVEAELAKVESEIQASVKDAMKEQPTEPEGTEELDPGQAYMHINAQKPNVKVTASGLQFEIIESGDGATPGPTARVVTHYEGSFIDGRVFDSSLDRGDPAEFPVNRVIAGWTEALQMMKEGDKWRLVIPPELAYGKRGAGGGRIPPNSVLVFEVELIKVKQG